MAEPAMTGGGGMEGEAPAVSSGESRKRFFSPGSFGFTVSMGLVGLLLLYVLSIGPVATYIGVVSYHPNGYNAGGLPLGLSVSKVEVSSTLNPAPVWLENLYRPLFYTCEFSPFLQKRLNGYMVIWGGNYYHLNADSEDIDWQVIR